MIRAILDWIRPRNVYTVQYVLGYAGDKYVAEIRYFRTLLRARRYVRRRAKLDKFIQRGIAELQIQIIPFHE